MHCNKYVIARPGPLSSGSTIFFADPAGNNFAVYVPTVEENNGTTERLTGVGYLELEAPKFDASIKFYEQVLGFKILERGGDAQSNKAQATLRMEPILINSPRLGSGARL